MVIARIGCRAMPAATVRLPVADFWADNNDWVTAILAILLAFVAATLLDRYFARRGDKLAAAVSRGEVSPVLDTRVRFFRRLIYAGILLVGVAIALSQFTGLSKLAASLLASGALVAAIVGFAARQVLANSVAGIMLAVTQPLRVGDWVTFEENYGVVEDVRLNFTVLRTASDQRVIIPNERLAAGILRNDTLGSDAIGLDVWIWLPPDADTERALAALEDETGSEASVAEITPEGIRITVGGDPVPPPQKGPRQAELRAQCLKRLRAEGLLGGKPAS
jgi:small-conductance mechanosensitive channel